MPAKDSGIYVGVNFDLDPLATDINVVKSQLKTAGKEFSDVLDKAINTTKATKSIEKLTDSVAVLARMPKSVNFTPTINGLDAVAEKAGISKQRIEGLYGAMIKTSAAKAHEDALKNIQKQAGLSTAQMAKLRYELGDTSGAFKAMGAAALPVVGSIAAVGASALYMGKACFDAGLQLDRLHKAYGTVTGSSQGATAQLDYIYNVTNKLGLQFQTTAESAKGFFAAGMGTSLEKDLNGIFEGVSMAASSLSLTQEQVTRTFTALGQMISKGKVSAEEMRQQFGEHIPGAMRIAARAMGVTTSALDKMMSDGKLLAEDLLPKLGLTMREDFGAGSVEAAKGAQAAVNKLSSEWGMFKAQILDNESIIAAINGVTNALKFRNDELRKSETINEMESAGISKEGKRVQPFAGGRILSFYTEAQISKYKADQSAKQEHNSRMEALDEEHAKALEQSTNKINNYLSGTVDSRKKKLEEEYAAVKEAIASKIAIYKEEGTDIKDLEAQQLRIAAEYQRKVADLSKSGASGLKSSVSALNVYTAELEKTMSSVTALKAQLSAPAGDMFTLNQVKINKEYDQTLIAINKQVKEYEGKKGISKVQAQELETAKKIEAQLKKDLALREAESKNAEVRIDFEKRYADMVGATSQGVIDSIKKQTAEYASAGADRVRLAEWERDQIQRASTNAWDGASVALRDYSAEAGNQAKGMNEAFTGLFTGIDSGFSNMWSQILEDGKVSLSEFRKLFANFMADLMHMAITRPITVSIAGAVSGAIGFGSGTANAAAGGGSGSGGGFNIPGFNGSGLFNGISDTINESMMNWFPSTFGTGMVTNFAGSAGSLTSGTMSTAAINSIGSSGYGGMAFAPGANLPTFTSAISPALGWGSAGSAVGGMVSPYFNNMLGINNGKNAQIGSTVGGLGATGVMAGLAAANMWNPGGWVMAGVSALSSLFGGSMGGMFDKKPKKPAVWGGAEIDLGSDNLYSPGSYDFGATFDQKGYGRDSFEMYEDGNYAIATRSRNKASSDVSKAMSQIMREVAEMGVQQADAVQDALPDSYAAAFKEQLSANPISAEWDFKGDDINEESFKQAATELQEKMNASMLSAFQGMDFAEYAGKISVDQSTIEGLTNFTTAIKLTEETIKSTAEIGNPLSDLEQQANAAKAQLTEWTKAMETAGVTTEYAGQLMGDYSTAMIGKFISDLESSLNPLSQYEQAMKDANTAVDDRLAALTILGATEAELARVEGLRSQVLESMTGPMKLVFDQDMQIREAQLSGNAELISSTQLTIQHERELAEVRAKFGEDSAEYTRVLGIQAGELAQASAQLAAQAASLSLTFSQDMSLRYAQLGGDPNLVASTQLTIQHERELADIREKFGADSAQFAEIQYIHMVESAQAALKQQQAAGQAILTEFSTAAQKVLTEFTKAEAEFTKKASEAQSHLNAVRSAYLSALNKEASSIKATMDAVSRAVEQLSHTRRDLLTSAETSPLGTAERYALTGAELERVFVKAMSGDAESMDELAGLSSKYLDVSKEANSDFSKYRKDFERVQAMLAAVEASGNVQVSEAQKQIDLLNAQIAAATEGTGQIVGSIKELEAAFVAALGDYTSAQEAALRAQEATLRAQEAADEARRKAEEAANKAQQDSQQAPPKTWQQDVLERKAEDLNWRGETSWGVSAGRWTPADVLRAIAGNGLNFESWYQQFGKIEGFAKGGLASGWAMVGEQGPELVNFSNPGRVYTADDTAEMLNPKLSFQAPALSVSLPQTGNSNAELIAEIRELRREVVELRSEQSRSQFRIADATQRTARKLEQFDFDGLPSTRE